MTQNPNLVRGSLDLLILKSLSWGARHGYAISEWIESATGGHLLAEEGTLYPALHRLQGKKWVDSEWGLSDNNRRAKFYRTTEEGVRHLTRETERWAGYTQAVSQALALIEPDL